MSTSTSPTVASLFAAATQEGTLDPAAAAVIVPNMTANIQGALGVSVDDVQASTVVLLTILLDDSTSIESASNTQHVIDGANLVLDAVGSSKDDGILVCMRTLNRGTLYPYMSLSQAARISRANYTPDGFTPLNDMTAETVAASVVKAQEFANQGVPCRAITLIVTDGADVGSQHIRRPEGVKPLIDAALRTEQHIICAMGIDDGGTTDFRSVFSRMGLRDNWILTPKSNGHEIRQAFAMFSRSAARASQAATGGAFSKVAAGGFASP